MKLAWNEQGSRLFETGVDRGVLYVENLDGVAWNGLLGVDENPIGGDAEPYYLDGMKYLDESAPEEYGATISAFTFPPEFSECIGLASFGLGLYADHQPRKNFGFSYRTRVGDDVQGEDAGYKIHLVYNALAQPSNRAYKTIGKTVEPMEFSWTITTTPVPVSGHKYTAHLILDSRETYPALLSSLEDILYGTETTPPRMPSPVELKSIFDIWMKVFLFDDGVWSITCGDDILSITPDGQFTLNWPNAVFLDANTYTLSSVE